MDNSTNSLDLPALRISGTEVHYFVLCPRKLWWFSHGMEQEHVSGTSGAESVSMGQLLHQDAYPDREHRDVMIDNLLRLDFTESGQVQEVKKSRGGLKATRFQLLYYLYYLKHEKGMERTGVIEFPAQRRREEVHLTPALEREVEQMLADLAAVRVLPTPPVVPEPMPICKSCSYQELCWG